MTDLEGLFQQRRILWLNRCAIYCAGLHRTGAIRAVACIEGGPDCAAMRDRHGISFHAIEESRGYRQRWREEVVQEVLPEVGGRLRDLIERKGREGWVLTSPTASASIAPFAEAHGIGHASPALEPYVFLSDKRNFLDGLRALGLRRAPGRWMRIATASYAEIRKEHGDRFVVQQAVGSGGGGTLFVSSEADYARIGPPWTGEEVLVARDIGDLSININAVALRSGSVAGWPSVQLTGFPFLGYPPGAYCGNDYTAAAELGVALLQSIREQTVRLGNWIASLGHEGLFGVDYVVDRDTGDATPVDLNPRWQGSTALLTQAELREERLPLAVAELAWRTRCLDGAEISRAADAYFQPVRGSQFAVKWLGDDGPSPDQIQPGVFSRALERLRDGFELGHCLGDDDVVITGLPKAGLLLHRDAQLLRVMSLSAVLDRRTWQPQRWCREVSHEVLRRAGLNVDAVSPELGAGVADVLD